MRSIPPNPRYLDLSRRRGFTLVELLAVVSLMALLSGAALVSVRFPIQKASRQAMVERIRFLDSTARKLARSGDRVTLFLDPSQGIIELETVRQTGILRSEIPPGVQLKIREIESQRGAVGSRGDGDWQEDGTVVRYDRHGTSFDYAVEVSDRTDHGDWLVVFGLTGQTVVVPTEKDVWEVVTR